MQDFLNYVGPGLAVGLAGIGVAIGQGILAKSFMDVIGKRPSMSTFFLTISILGIALVESAVIYGLVIAFQLFVIENIGFYSSTATGLAIGLTGFGVGIGAGVLIAGALSAMNRNPDIKGKLIAFMILFIALIEVVAIYGLIISFTIMNNGIENPAFIGAGIAIGFAGLGVAIGQGFLSSKSLEIMGQNPKMMTFFLTVTILGMALVESAAIYGLVIAFNILSNEGLSLYSSLGAGIAIGLTGLGAGIGEGFLVKGALNSMNLSPETKGKTMAFMVLFIALVEVVAIYGLIISFKILSS